MTEVAAKLSERSFKLRSGAAIGADTAFRKGAKYEHIYYPSDVTKESMQMAESFHGLWNSLNMFGKRLHGRNPFQVLGSDLKSPSKFLICWTSDGCICHADRTIRTGGTGTAISIASENNIQVFNLKREDHLRRILNWLES